MRRRLVGRTLFINASALALLLVVAPPCGRLLGLEQIVRLDHWRRSSG